MYLQRLSTRYLERPRRGQPARHHPVRPLWRLGASSRLRFAREGTRTLRRKKGLITVRPFYR